MGATALLADVGLSERLSLFNYDTNGANQAHWVGPNSTSIGNLGTTGAGNVRSWIRINKFSMGAFTGTSRWVYNNYVGGTTYHGLRFLVASGAFEHVWLNSSSNVIPVMGVAVGVISNESAVITWGDTTQWGIGQLIGGENISEPTFVKDTENFNLGTSGVNYQTLIVPGVYRKGHFNGSTSGNSFVGHMGLDVLFMTELGESLADYGLDTDDAKKLVLMDPQRLFTVHGVTGSQLINYGNWTNSSNTPKTAFRKTQFAAGDKLICPFSSKALTLVAGAATSTELAVPDGVTPAIHDPFIIHQGSLPYHEDPIYLRTPDGVILGTHVQVDNLTNYFNYMVRLDSDSNITSPPINIPYGYRYNDSSDSNNIKVLLNRPLANTNSDGHSACPINFIFEPDGETIKGIMGFPFMHSVATANQPASGDTLSQDAAGVFMDDDGVQLIYPTATPELVTYGWMLNANGYLSVHSRKDSSFSAENRISQFNHSDLSVEHVQYLNSTGSQTRNYPSFCIGPFSDDYCIATFWGLVGPSGDGIVSIGAIMFPTGSDFTDNSKWFTPTGKECDGVGGNPTLGSMNLHQNWADLSITPENQTWFENLPIPTDGTDGVNVMDHIIMERPGRTLSGGREGFAAVVRLSPENADFHLIVSGTPSSVAIPYTITEIRQYTYTPGPSRTIEQFETHDITDIIAEFLPGDWPPNDTVSNAEYTRVHAMWCNLNQMILLIGDSEVATEASRVTSNYGCYQAFTLRGLFFYDMGGSDPTKYIDMGVLYSIDTDFSEGYGFNFYPVNDIDGYQRGLGIHLFNGDYSASSAGIGSFKHVYVNLEDAIAAAEAAIPSTDAFKFQQLNLPSI